MENIDWGVDDFSNLPPLEDIGEASLKPTSDVAKKNRMLEMLQQVNPKAIALGKGKSIMHMHDQGSQAPHIAEHTGLEVSEVKSVTSVYQELEPDDKASLKSYALPKSSVFNLFERLEEQLKDLNDTMKYMDDPEIKILYFGERLKLFKLSLAVTNDLSFKKKQEEEQNEKMQIILDAISEMDSAAATKVFKKLRAYQEQKNLLS